MERYLTQLVQRLHEPRDRFLPAIFSCAWTVARDIQDGIISHQSHEQAWIP